MNQQKICIIGNGLAGLITAVVLSEEDIKIDLIFPKVKNFTTDYRTTAVSETNFNFLKKRVKFEKSKIYLAK